MDRLESTGIHDPGAASEPFEETVVGGEEYERIVEPHPAGSKVGRYVILDRVGHGGMGVVYAAFDPELNRRVALKILHARKHGTTRHAGPPGQRLLREAQAIARVSHPNVISVYDVGTVGESVFVAMEFVDGTTLTRWQAEQTDIATIVAMYAAAGRGLAAAHQAGIVHRDFKPDNVLIGSDGQPRVLDFGLARTAPDPSGGSSIATAAAPRPALAPDDDPIDPVVDPERSDVGGARLDSPLTMEGAVVGTPRFMAPEQHAGAVSDARSDQFSFCVALYQAVYRQEPFAANTLERLALAKQRGEIRRPRSDARVPAHVESAILRGLETDPGARWPDMGRLVEVLGFDAKAARRRWLLAAGTTGLVVAAATAGMWFARAGAVTCSSAGGLAGVWDEDRRAEVATALGGVDVPYAPQVTVQTLAALDAYAARWSTGYDAACAVHERGEQSTALFDRRMQCLAVRRGGLAALVEVLVGADASVVERAGQAAAGLAAIEPCGDAEYLLAVVEPPPEAVRLEVAAVRERLAQVQALAAAGRTKAAREQLVELVREADALDHAPLRAEVLARHGSLLESFGEYPQAEDELHRALQIALRAGHDEVAASAAVDLASVVGDRLSRHAEGLRWLALGTSLLERLGLDEVSRGRVDTIEGNIRYRMGDLAVAERSYERALVATERARGPDDPAVAVRLGNLGNVYYRQHRRELTLSTYERAAAITEAAYGPSHPATAIVYFGLANALTALERWDEAEVRLEAARATYREAFGEAHPNTIACVCNLGVVEEGRNRPEQALRRFEECSALTARTLGRAHPDFAMSLFNLSRLHRESGALGAARVELDEALAIRKKVLGDDHRETLEAMSASAELSLLAGDWETATREFEEVIDRGMRVGADPLVLAEARFGYARAASTRAPPSELALARAIEARDAFAADGSTSAEARGRVEAWLAEPRSEGAQTRVLGPDDPARKK